MKRFLTQEDLDSLPADKFDDFYGWCLRNGCAVKGLPLERSLVDASILLLWLKDHESHGYVSFDSLTQDGKFMAFFTSPVPGTCVSDGYWTIADCPVDVLWAACKRVMGVTS